MVHRSVPIAATVVTVGALAGCVAARRTPTPSVSPDAAAAATAASRPAFDAGHPMPPWARHLRGLRICVDPGHGGDGHLPNYKRGPTGVREAEVNLRVALALRGFLEAAGAEVVLTRTDDSDVSLDDRSATARREGCDLFLSIHHNAVSNAATNYGSVWVHAEPDHSPASLDLAASIHREVSRILALPQSASVPLLSDRLMYRSGFAVLRGATMPAVLSEASFHTNPEEERRLADPAYNRLEAYGHFLGLARYAEGGLPRARLLATALPRGEPALRVALDDGLQSRKGWGSERARLVVGSIAVKIDGRPVPFAFDDARAIVSIDVRSLGPGLHACDVRFENAFKHSNHPTRFAFEILPGPGGPGPATRPAVRDAAVGPPR